MSAGFAVLLWLHLIGAVGWLGSAVVFGMLIGPTLPSLSPASRGELVVKLFPKYVFFLQIFTLITPVFGLGLALYISHGDTSIFTPNNPFSTYIDAGAILTLVTWALTFGVATPAAGKVIKLTKEAMAGSGPPSPDLAKASARLRISAAVGMVILFVIVACMVIAAVGI